MAKAVKTKQMGVKTIKSLNVGFYGEEPIYNRELAPKELEETLTWYNYNMDTKDGVDYLAEWMSKNAYDADKIKVVRSAGEKFFPFSIFKLARILNVGGLLPAYAIKWLTEGIEDGYAKYAREKSEKVETPKYTVSRLNEEYAALANEIENAIDARNKSFDLVEFLADKSVTDQTAIKIAAHYQTEVEKAKKLIADDDTTTDMLMNYVSYLEKIVTEAKIFAKVDTQAPVKVVKPRKPRVKKVVPPEKKVAKLKYLKEHTDLGIQSIEPKDIIGKKALWYFDTKYNKLTVVRSETGLDVKGSTIIFDEKTSESKRVGRRVRFAVDTVTKGGKVALRNLFKEFKTEAVEVTGRINENTILLKVEK